MTPYREPLEPAPEPRLSQKRPYEPILMFALGLVALFTVVGCIHDCLTGQHFESVYITRRPTLRCNEIREENMRTESFTNEEIERAMVEWRIREEHEWTFECEMARQNHETTIFCNTIDRDR